MTLPHTPSKLTRLALADLELAEQDPRYYVTMNEWHNPRHGVCEVCLAGSVMAFTLQYPQSERFDWAHVDTDTRLCLIALDRFAAGSIRSGASMLSYLDIPQSMWYLPVAPYKSSPAQFKKDMRALAAAFERIHL